MAQGHLQARTLSAIATALAQRGDPSQARDLWAQAIVAAQAEPDPQQKDSGIWRIVTELAKSGQFPDAEQTAATISSENDFNGALRDIVRAYVMAGRFADAETISATLTLDFWRAWALNDRAAAHASVGQVMMAHFLWTEATEIADAIENQHMRRTALVTIANARVAAGQLAEALRISNTVGTEFAPVQRLIDISSRL